MANEKFVNGTKFLAVLEQFAKDNDGIIDDKEQDLIETLKTVIINSKSSDRVLAEDIFEELHRAAKENDGIVDNNEKRILDSLIGLLNEHIVD